jgi:hypothetical protein
MKTLIEETELMKVFASKIQAFYNYCGYNVDKDQIIGLCKTLVLVKPSIDIEFLDSFLTECKKGKLGMIYQSPISLMVAFQKFNVPKFVF